MGTPSSTLAVLKLSPEPSAAPKSGSSSPNTSPFGEGSDKSHSPEVKDWLAHEKQQDPGPKQRSSSDDGSSEEAPRGTRGEKNYTGGGTTSTGRPLGQGRLPRQGEPGGGAPAGVLGGGAPGGGGHQEGRGGGAGGAGLSGGDPPESKGFFGKGCCCCCQ